MNIPKVGNSIRIRLIHWNADPWVNNLLVSFSVHRHLFARMDVARLDYILTLLSIIYIIYRFSFWIILFFTLFFLRFITKGTLGFWSFFWLVTFAVFGLYFINEIISIVLSLGAMEFDASHPRVVQGKALIEDFTLFGKGLGGTVPNYSRDSLGYGFELSYHNIVHKFGVISLFIFGSFLLPIFYSLYSIFLRPNRVYSYLPLIFMLYLLPAWGNPMIFTPVSVVLHCLALYFIRRDKLEETMNV